MASVHSRIRNLLAELDPALRVTLLDVGSIGGLKGRWTVIKDRVNSIGFDPREEGSEPIEKENAKIYPMAVSDKPGSATLYITEFGNMSSLLPPNEQELNRFQKWGAGGKQVGEEALEVSTIDALLPATERVDAIKVDTQGSELMIMAGAEKLLSKQVFVAELEVSFFERYKGQPLADDVFAYMRARGFDLADLYQLRYYFRDYPDAVGFKGLGDQGQSGQLAYADAIFIADDARASRIIDQEKGDAKARRLASALLAMMVYGKLDRMGALVHAYPGVLPKPAETAFLTACAGVRSPPA